MIDETLTQLRALGEADGRFAYATELPAVAARCVEAPAVLSERLRRYLTQAGIRLYTHQAATAEHVLAGRNVVLATPTASGKTLAFNLPVFTLLEQDPAATALYLYPTKALANDQLRALGDLQQATGLDLGTAVYDGDTPRTVKQQIRKTSRLVLTNPHGLHQYLPHHQLWRRFLRNLTMVVIDEAHHYRGVFGSNVAMVLRRLWRLARCYGADPQVLLASGTIANPAEHAERLTGKPCEVIAASGAARGPKQFVIWNPVHLPDRSAHLQAADLLAALVRQGHQTLCFTVSRAMAELTARWAGEHAPGHTIAAYRAGYRPGDRRRLEQGLQTGAIHGVASTTALELGVDIGSLDAVVMAGYPGTIMGTWQQAGRAGRGTQPSLVILVAFDDPLDQYLAAHPKTLLDKPPEHAVIDLKNPHITAGHVLCAAAERPVTDADHATFGSTLPEALATLNEQDLLVGSPTGWRARPGVWAPAQVPLDAIDDGAVTVWCGQEVLEALSLRRALVTAHPGAILLHQGETYEITALDLDAQTATARARPTDLYTEASVVPELRITAPTRSRQLPIGTLTLGEVDVTDHVVSYKRKRYDRVVDERPLTLPPVTFPTVAVWLTPSDQLRRDIQQAGLDWLGGLHAAEHAMIHMLPLHAMCDPRDLGGLSTTRHPDLGSAGLFIYDGHPGGIGITAKAFELFEQLAHTTWQLVSDCACADGCPSCVYDRQCGNANSIMDKHAALRILDPQRWRPAPHAASSSRRQPSQRP